VHKHKKGGESAIPKGRVKTLFVKEGCGKKNQIRTLGSSQEPLKRRTKEGHKAASWMNHLNGFCLLGKKKKGGKKRVEKKKEGQGRVEKEGTTPKIGLLMYSGIKGVEKR